MIFQNTPKFDWAQQGKHALAMLMENAMVLYGLPATVNPAQVFDNGYEPYMPEFTQDPQPAKNIKVLLGQPVEGVVLSDFISNSDKVMQIVSVTTLSELNINDQLNVQFPDGKTWNLRVIENWAYHAFSSVVYRYKARVA